MIDNVSIFDATATKFAYSELATLPNGEVMQQLYLQFVRLLRRFYDEPVDATYSFDDYINKKRMWSVGSIDFGSMNLNWDQAMRTLQAVYADRPLLFFSDIYKTGGAIEKGIINPLIDAECSRGVVRRFYVELIEKDLRSTIAGLNLNRNKKAIAKDIFTIMRNTAAYDHNKGDGKYTNYVDIPSHSILNYMRNRAVVCQGFARSYQAFMNLAGVPTVALSVVMAQGLHSVNFAYLEDEKKWIMIDINAGMFDFRDNTYRQVTDSDKTMEYFVYEPYYRSIWDRFNSGE